MDDPVNRVGGGNAIAIGSDGRPVISYHDDTAGSLKVAKCGNAACTGGSIITTVDNPANEVGASTSIVIGTDGRPIISYHDVTAGALKVARCGNAACTSGNSISTVDDPANDVGAGSSIAIGADGLPVVAYRDTTTDALKVAKCGNATCTTGNTISTVADRGIRSGFVSVSIAIGADGLPVISHHDATARTLLVTKCGRPGCQ